MSIIQAIFSGIIQGLTEFLPISSSGHLILFPYFLKLPDQGLTFDVILHLATALSIICALFPEIKKIFNLKSKIYLKILIAIIPAGLTGFFIEKILNINLRSVELVAFNLIFFGFLLWLADFKSNQQPTTKQITDIQKISVLTALKIGFMQILSLSPGTSRSGITITAGLFGKLDKKTAISFSFLLGLPLFLAATILEIPNIKFITLTTANVWPLIFGFIAAFISGFLTIKFLLNLINKIGFKYFAIYRILLGVLILIISLS